MGDCRRAGSHSIDHADFHQFRDQGGDALVNVWAAASDHDHFAAALLGRDDASDGFIESSARCRWKFVEKGLQKGLVNGHGLNQG